jgi:hypothetical protein
LTDYRCTNAESQQLKRHRNIILLIQRYEREEEGELSKLMRSRSCEDQQEQQDKLRKKERKARKSLVRSVDKLDVITQAELTSLENLIYPKTKDAQEADDALSDALAAKFSPTIFAEKRMLDTLMMPPREHPDLENEANRVIAACVLAPPSSKASRALIDQIRVAIKEDIDVQWRTELEMKRRRIKYAQWVTQGAVDNMAMHYEEWDINTGERTNRRWKGDVQTNITGGEVREDGFDADDEGDLANIISPKRKWSKVESIATPEISVSTNASPQNDKRRGGRIINQPNFASEDRGDKEWVRSGTFTRRRDSLTNENAIGGECTLSPSRSCDCRITPERKLTSPWATHELLDLSVKPPSSTSPNEAQWPVVGSPSRKESATAQITPQRPAWMRDTKAERRVESEPFAVKDMVESPPQATMAGTLRITTRPIVDEPVAEDGWTTVSKKGKKA